MGVENKKKEINNRKRRRNKGGGKNALRMCDEGAKLHIAFREREQKSKRKGKTK